MISRRRLRHIENRIHEKVTHALEFASTAALKTIKLDPDALYVQLFGSKTPYKHSTTLTPELQRICDLYASPKASTAQHNTDVYPKPLVRPSRQLTLTMPFSPTACLKCAPVTDAFPIYGFAEERDTWGGRWGGRGERGFVRFSYTAQDSIPEELVARCRSLLIEALGEEEFSALDRLDTLHFTLEDLPRKFYSYAQHVRSLGGLYKKLPVLNSIVPNSDVSHVTMTRLTPDPPVELTQKLDLLATLWSAVESSRKS